MGGFGGFEVDLDVFLALFDLYRLQFRLYGFFWFLAIWRVFEGEFDIGGVYRGADLLVELDSSPGWRVCVACFDNFDFFQILCTAIILG